MPTIRQKLLLKELQQGSKNIKQSALKAGYSLTSASRGQAVLNTTGMRKLMQEYGLTPELVFDALADDIKYKKRNRVRELELASKILGLTQEKVQHDHTIKKDLSETEIDAIIQRYEQSKAEVINNEVVDSK